MILTALNDYYDRLVEQDAEGIAPYGYSYEQISYALVISKSGELVDVQDVRDLSGKKPRPGRLCVPQPPKRSVNVEPCFLWDKTAYVLGVTAKTDERSLDRALITHKAFRDTHKDLLSKEDDPAIVAFLAFLDKWQPEDFGSSPKINDDILDTNVVFRLDGDKSYIHEKSAARLLRGRIAEATGTAEIQCLVSGNRGALALTHASIKGVNGAQSAGASIVSFNLDSSTSYLKSQGDNAPISEESAFAYTTALNYLLRREEHNRQRIQIGDATVVFWAEADSRKKSELAESLFANLLSPPAVDDESEAGKLRSVLEAVAQGRALQEIDPELDPATRIYILGLSPNASRLSIRFWEQGSIQQFAEKLAEHFGDLWLEPSPWSREPGIWRLLLETVPHREGSRPKADDIHPLLAGELTRSILTGSRYPRSLLSNLIMRMRADGDLSSLRAALCKAVLARDLRKGVKGNLQEVPVSLDIDNTEPGYLLGRMFSVLENIQKSALGKELNATIRDRYYGSASATPATVFPVLIRNTQHHLSRLRKDKPGLAVNLEKDLGEIVGKLGPEFPRSLRIESQGHFAIGYYHQTQSRYAKKELVQEGEEA
ncbi:MAG: type I-C CRISPR-associated protein Cas8c/Csd1 [Cellvibrionaceae bacterium]